MNELDEILRLANCVEAEELFEMADSFDIELSEDFVIESGIVGFTNDGIIIEGDEKTLSLLAEHGLSITETDYECEEPHQENDIAGLIRKLDEIGIVPRSDRKVEVRDLQDYREKRKELQRIMMSGEMVRDPQLRRQVIIQLAALDDAAKEKGLELAEGEDTGIIDVLRDIANGKLDGYKVYTQPKNPAEKEISNMIYSKFSSTLKSYRDQDKPEPDDLDKVIDDIIADLTKEHKVDEMMIMGNSNEPSESIQMEAEYHGRKVQLGKPFFTPDGPKKRSVYVKKPNGKVVKVNFGDKKMRIKKSNPARRKSFRARHRCENPGPRWKARYWACRTW